MADPLDEWGGWFDSNYIDAKGRRWDIHARPSDTDPETKREYQGYLRWPDGTWTGTKTALCETRAICVAWIDDYTKKGGAMADAPTLETISSLDSTLGSSDEPRWIMAQMRGVGAAVEAAIARSKAEGWAKGTIEDRTADFRAMFYASLWMYNALSMVPPGEKDLGTAGKATIVTSRKDTDFSSYDRFVWAAMSTIQTWNLIWNRYAKDGGTEPDVVRIGTVDGDPAFKLSTPTILGEKSGGVAGVEAGAWPAWLVGVGIVSGAVVVCFIADRTAVLIDRYLEKNADTSRMMATQGRAMDVLNAHKEAEAKAGKELPLTDAEKKILADLQEIQKKYAAATAAGKPYPSFFGEGGKGILSDLGILVGLGIVGFLALKH